MKKVKQILALLLVAVFFIGVIPMSTVPALAATNGHTQSEAVNWASSKVGSVVGGSVECVAFVREYYSYLGYSVRGDGKDYENNVMDGWTRTYYYSGYIPQPGDIAVWRVTKYKNGTINTYGHVAIVESANSSKMTILEQGSSMGCVKRNSIGYGWYGELTCFIRPNFNTVVDAPAPTNVWVSLPFGEESSYKINSSVDISFGADNATQFNLQIYKGQEKYWYGEFYAPSGSTVCPASFDSVGHYSCYVTAVNFSGKTAQSGWIGWDIVDEVPSDLSISLNNRNPFNVYNINDEIIFSLNAKFGYYKHIGIHSSDGTIIKESDVSGCSFSFSTDKTGVYYADFDAMNACGSSRSEKIYFEVVSGVPSKTGIQIIEPTTSDYYIGDTLTFKLIADGANVISWGIHKDNNLVAWNYIECKTLKYTFNTPGEYSISIDAMNEYGTVRSDSYYFTIKDSRSYSVSYNANGGSNAPASQSKTHDVNLTLSSAKPTGKSFTVSYNANGGNVSSSSKTVSQTFTNWNTAANGSGTAYNAGATYSANASVTLYAQYANPSIGFLPTPTRSGYGFDGWYTAANGGTKITDSTKVTANTTLYAHWKANAYTVSYNANGGSNAPASQSKTHDVNLTLSSAKPTGKSFTVSYNANGGNISTTSKVVSQTFTNWNTAANGNGTAYNAGATYSANANVTLYAQYANPSFGSLPTPTRSGYGFDGWYTAANGGTKITDSTKVTANTTVYAHWTKNTETKATVKGVKVEHGASLNFKSSYALVPEITADEGAKYTVKYESSNTSVATVGNDGKIYGAKKGNATITCTVTDSYGNVVKDSCNVNVDYSGAQWFIIIVLFGWIWYI